MMTVSGSGAAMWLPCGGFAGAVKTLSQRIHKVNDVWFFLGRRGDHFAAFDLGND